MLIRSGISVLAASFNATAQRLSRTCAVVRSHDGRFAIRVRADLALSLCGRYRPLERTDYATRHGQAQPSHGSIGTSSEQRPLR